MLSKLIVLILLLVPSAVMAQGQSSPKPVSECSIQTPYTAPSVKPGMTVICRHAYEVGYDGVAKIPVWVAYTLTPQHAVGCLPRTNNFEPDASIPKSQSAELSDYAKSGYDIGHLANAADMSWDAEAMQESFFLTNMSPQLPSVNRGLWKILETDVRAWAWSSQHSLTIYDGNIYTIGKSKTIGHDAVVVPDYLYKIVIDNNTKQVQAFLFPHKDGLGSNITTVLSTISTIESMTGIVFPVPQGVDKTLRPTSVWPVDLKAIAIDKKSQCGG